MGIEILPPDVNLSDHEFVVVDGNIRFGLDAVKGVGYAAVEAIKARARGGRAVRLDLGLLRARRPARGQQEGDRGADQVRRVRLDRRVAQGHARRCSSRRRPPARRPSRTPQIGQGSIFDLLGGAGRRRTANGAAAAFAAPSHPPIPAEEFDQHELLARREGVDRPVHLRAPAQGGARGAAAEGRLPAGASCDERKDGEWVTVGGIITAGARRSARAAATTMMFATLDDLEGTVEILVFGKALAEYEGALGVDEVVLVRGRVDHKDAARPASSCRPSSRSSPTDGGGRGAREAGGRGVAIGPEPLTRARSTPAQLPATIIEELKHVFEQLPGRDRGRARHRHLARARGRCASGQGYRVAETPSLRAELGRILGPARWRRRRAAAVASSPSLRFVCTG